MVSSPVSRIRPDPTLTTANSDHPSREQILLRQPRHCSLEIEYVDIVLSQKMSAVNAIKGNPFKVIYPRLTQRKTSGGWLGIAQMKRRYQEEIEVHR
ncbi:hypothetical protein P691DRAFT_802973 [Macrolepiota fuliginosa MF-IS2]|uniref:Uncharacterized protein n=1 Tax=Macrolepiota fuliginosa MF-IS2 TaxID=1400762 RepID=A0A9P6C2X5_9AGAR|nr:hypothetical protein P691DRAFT_802973 [Macrolepiota fuliginosa MF-IS2]